MDDARAKIRLEDGREVWRDGAGRYREVGSGRWVAAQVVEAGMSDWQPEQRPRSGLSASARAQVRQDLAQAVQQLGLDVSSPEEAYGKLIAVQAQIAMDKENGARATSAVRLIGQAAGLLEEEEEAEDADQPWFVLGRQLAKEVLGLVEAEQARRER